MRMLEVGEEQGRREKNIPGDAQGNEYRRQYRVDPGQFPLFCGVGDSLVRRTHTQARSPAL